MIVVDIVIRIREEMRAQANYTQLHIDIHILFSLSIHRARAYDYIEHAHYNLRIRSSSLYSCQSS